MSDACERTNATGLCRSTEPSTQDRGAARITSLWRLAAVRGLVALSLLGFTSFCLTLAALPSWAVQGGTSRGTAGIVTTAMLATTVLTQLGVPALERRLGVKRVLALGLLALGAPAPLYLISHQLGWLCAISAVRGLGFAVLTVIGATLTTRVAPADRLGEAVGVYGLAIALPSLIAVPGGAALTLSGHFAWVAILGALPVLALAALPLLGDNAPAPRAPTVDRIATPDAAASANAATLLGGRPVPGGTAPRRTAPGGARIAARAALGPSSVLLVVTLAGGGFLTFLPIERPRGALAGIVLLLFGVTAALTRWRAGVFADRSGPSGPARLLVIALGCAALGLSGVAGTLHGVDLVSVTALAISAALFGVGFGAVQNVTQLVAFRRAGAEHTTTASAIWNAAFDSGTGIGAFAVGAASVGIGLGWTFAACALLILAAIPVALTTSSR